MIATAPTALPESLTRVPEAESTNTVLLAAAFGQEPREPLALWADHQTGGRGRRGRRWVASPGSALTFSIALERAVPANARPPVAFPLVTGLLVREALLNRLNGEGEARLRLKWPNDLLLDDRKLAGVLIESRRQGRIERLVIGIGLNLRADDSLPDTATTLAALCPDWADADSLALVNTLRGELAQALTRYGAQGFEPWRECWQRVDAFAGRAVRLLEGERLLAEGVDAGVAADGALRLRTADGRTHEHRLGELSLRAHGASPGGSGS